MRRAWLWGVDEYAGRDYSHRKQWVLERLTYLSGMYAIDLCAYAVMSNHYHLVLHVDQARTQAWSAEEVIRRWTLVFSAPPLVKRWQDGLCGVAEKKIVEVLIERWRRRLCDVSWYMRCLNEHLARRANLEDNCTGRFWEGRFRSQALLDEAGLLTAMAYVDLNPIRAGTAATPEASDFTSIQSRIERIQREEASTSQDQALQPEVPLLDFSSERASRRIHLPFDLRDYLELVDKTGRVERRDQRGTIDERQLPILMRLNIDPRAWEIAMHSRSRPFGRALGQLDHLRLHARTLGQSWVRGLRRAEACIGADEMS